MKNLIKFRFSVARTREIALVASIGLAFQMAVIGTAGDPPPNVFSYDSNSDFNAAGSAALPADLKFISYASHTGSALDTPKRDTVALLSVAGDEGSEYPLVTLVRSAQMHSDNPSLTLRKSHAVVENPTAVPGANPKFAKPNAFARGDLDPLLANEQNTTVSEELLIGFREADHSQIAIIQNFDSQARADASNASPKLVISKFIRFNCASGAVQYDPETGLPAYPECLSSDVRSDPSADVTSIAVADLNCDGRQDLSIVADSTTDANKGDVAPGELSAEPGQRFFVCLNYTPQGSRELDFRCRYAGGAQNGDESSAARARAGARNGPAEYSETEEGPTSPELNNGPLTVTVDTSRCSAPWASPGVTSFPVPSGANILDAAEAAGVMLPFSGRAGADSSSAALLQCGNVDQADGSFLDEEQVARGYILTDVAYPLSDIRMVACVENQLWQPFSDAPQPIPSCNDVEDNLPAISAGSLRVAPVSGPTCGEFIALGYKENILYELRGDLRQGFDHDNPTWTSTYNAPIVAAELADLNPEEDDGLDRAVLIQPDVQYSLEGEGYIEGPFTNGALAGHGLTAIDAVARVETCLRTSTGACAPHSSLAAARAGISGGLGYEYGFATLIGITDVVAPSNALPNMSALAPEIIVSLDGAGISPTDPQSPNDLKTTSILALGDYWGQFGSDTYSLPVSAMQLWSAPQNSPPQSLPPRVIGGAVGVFTADSSAAWNGTPRDSALVLNDGSVMFVGASASAEVPPPPPPASQFKVIIDMQRCGGFGSTTIDVSSDETILVAAERAGLDLPYSQRDGSDTASAAKVINGLAHQNPESALTDDQIAAGYILLDSASPRSDLTVMACSEDELY